MKWSLELPVDIGDEVYIVENDRNWANVGEITINDENGNGRKNITFYWYQMDKGPDGDELWDEGWFDLEDIGTKVLIEGIHDDLIKENVQKKENYYFECMHKLVKENCGEYILHGKRACVGCKLSRANYEPEGADANEQEKTN